MYLLYIIISIIDFNVHLIQESCRKMKKFNVFAKKPADLHCRQAAFVYELSFFSSLIFVECDLIHPL